MPTTASEARGLSTSVPLARPAPGPDGGCGALGSVRHLRCQRPRRCPCVRWKTVLMEKRYQWFDGKLSEGNDAFDVSLLSFAGCDVRLRRQRLV